MDCNKFGWLIPDDAYLRPQDVADGLGISPKTVRDWTTSTHHVVPLRCMRSGNIMIIKGKHLKAFLDRLMGGDDDDGKNSGEGGRQ